MKNDRAERQDILVQLNKLARTVKEDDIFLLYFSGHGVRNAVVNDETYWMTYDAEIDKLDVNGIRLRHLLDYVQDIKANTKIVLLDHCYSGDIVNNIAASSGDIVNRGPGGDSLSLTRGSTPIEKLTNDLRQDRKGMVILAAARGDALEAAEFGHGMFTYALLKAMTSRCADLNRDGNLSVLELQEYLGKKIDSLAHDRGSDQKLIPFAIGTGLVNVPVVENLPISSSQEAVQKKNALLSKLNKWFDKNFLTDGTVDFCTRLIDKYFETETPGSSLTAEELNRYNKITTKLTSIGSETSESLLLENYVQAIINP